MSSDNQFEVKWEAQEWRDKRCITWYWNRLLSSSHTIRVLVTCPARLALQHTLTDILIGTECTVFRLRKLNKFNWYAWWRVDNIIKKETWWREWLSLYLKFLPSIWVTRRTLQSMASELCVSVWFDICSHQPNNDYTYNKKSSHSWYSSSTAAFSSRNEYLFNAFYLCGEFCCFFFHQSQICWEIYVHHCLLA